MTRFKERKSSFIIQKFKSFDYKKRKTEHTMSSLQLVNAQADIVRKAAALGININAAKGLQEVLKTNLGPKGTLKM